MSTRFFIFSRLRPDLRIILGLVLWKLVYFLLLIAGITCGSDYDEPRAATTRETWFPPVQARWLEQQQTGLQRHFVTWDAAHYLVLSQSGYSAQLRSCAFYPLWPCTIRWAAKGIRASPVVWGMVLANLLSVGGWWMFWRNTAGRFGESAANWALIHLLVFPGALFHQFIYSEPQFFLLLMVLWKGMESRSYSAAGLAAYLLPLSRAIGLFALLPILVHGWERWRELPVGSALKAEGGFRIGNVRLRVVQEKLTGPAVLAIAPVLGWVTGLLLMRHWTGDALHGFEAQEHWRVHSIANLWDVPKFVLGFLTPTSWHEFRGSVLDRFGFLLMLASIPLLWRRGKDLLSWVLILCLIPAMSGTFTSFIRFESVAFPIFIALGVWSAGAVGQRRAMAVGLVSAMASLHVILVWRFVNHGWAG